MRIGIYLPTIIPGVGARDARRWARRAEELGFATVAVTDRGADEPFEPLASAYTALAVTRRIGVFGDVTFSPTWTAELSALHTASLDRAGGGRYTAGVTFADPLAIVDGLDATDSYWMADAQLAELHRADRSTGVVPAAGPPPLVIGGRGGIVAELVARHADGWLMRAGSPEAFATELTPVRDAWATAGRVGRPVATAAFGFALGDLAASAAEVLHDRLRATQGAEVAAAVVAGSAADEAAVRERVAAFAAAGADQVLAVPSTPDITELDRLAAVLPRLVHA
ncbi:luciferase [Actinomycetospora sp. NBRC 106375]|uniref:LLM class flavin-dependent oxidoreductase n=1 Tax=Actinomycetospora sp. NBRC 106375 TaxID=3032207 RepID=UPI00249FFC3B|nr:LLM class flavin-dependent oxidoreductase [Actinomycetospora sp. NBRC 106375]GLZ49744.1 luciferase [Actinomycetospora sp. NBRC 106375]